MVMSSQMTKFIPNINFPPPKVKIPPVHQDDIPQFTFAELLEISKFNDIDKMDIQVGEKGGTRFLYVHNILENPLDMRKMLMQFPAENRAQSAKEALKLNKGTSFSTSKAPGLQQPIERQLMPAFGNELFFLIGHRLNFIKYRRESITWKYFSNCFYPGMTAWNRNYLPHMDPFSYAANIFLTDHPKACTTFFRYTDPVTGIKAYNLYDINSQKSVENGTKERYIKGLMDRYGYLPAPEIPNGFKSPNVQAEPWEHWKGDDFYEDYLELPSCFNTMSFYAGKRWHSACYDAQNEESARYSLVAVIE